MGNARTLDFKEVLKSFVQKCINDGLGLTCTFLWPSKFTFGAYTGKMLKVLVQKLILSNRGVHELFSNRIPRHYFTFFANQISNIRFK